MSQCQNNAKREVLINLCLSLRSREENFVVGQPSNVKAKAAAVVTYTAKCQKLFYKA